MYGKLKRKVLVSISAGVLATGCANFGSVDGVENLWREVPIDSFQEGRLTFSSCWARHPN